MARNKAISSYREKRKEDDLFCDIDEYDIPDDANGDSTLRITCAKEGEEAVFECLQMLDEKYREVLDFYYFNHNSVIRYIVGEFVFCQCFRKRYNPS